VWRRRETESPALDRETVDGIIRLLVEINVKLDRLLHGDEEDDGEED
jgi:hypothetical protein